MKTISREAKCPHAALSKNLPEVTTTLYLTPRVIRTLNLSTIHISSKQYKSTVYMVISRVLYFAEGKSEMIFVVYFSLIIKLNTLFP